jgi:hypothetical protein
MDTHLQNARTALSRASRIGGQPKPEDVLLGMHKAIEEILYYLEESEQRGRNERLLARAAKMRDK